MAAIARRLLVANAAACPDLHHDFGVVLGSPSAVSWGAQVAQVWPDGAAAAAGLQGEDRVRRVNGVPWSTDRGELTKFATALAQIPQATRLELAVERHGVMHRLTLTGQPRCAVEVRLSPRPVINAAALGHTIVIGGGLEQLLRDDSELAFAVAHEMAHVVLGHTAPARRAEISAPARRRALEEEADKLALRLMAQASYDAAAASAAWLKIADASRPALVRLLDIHGPYPATAVRAAYLADEARHLADKGNPWRLGARLAR
ncbi:MAG: M48 family metalloprotease [Sphingomonadales bacterium]|nr:M48 family metalloprotease [Sphingomonadales bacterium]